MSEALIEKQSFEGWAILELMGHRRLGGYVRQVDMFGTAMCRVDVPATETEHAATQFYSGASIYCMTPTTEETAKRVAEGYRPAPVNQWELPKPPSLPRGGRSMKRIERDDDDEGYDEQRDPDDVMGF